MFKRRLYISALRYGKDKIRFFKAEKTLVFIACLTATVTDECVAIEDYLQSTRNASRLLMTHDSISYTRADMGFVVSCLHYVVQLWGVLIRRSMSTTWVDVFIWYKLHAHVRFSLQVVKAQQAGLSAIETKKRVWQKMKNEKGGELPKDINVYTCNTYSTCIWISLVELVCCGRLLPEIYYTRMIQN